MLKRGNKRGQEVMGMSFSTIMSIIIIIVIIAVAIYAIVYFLSINKCTNVGFFYDDLQSEVDRQWTAGRGNEIFEKEVISSGAMRSGVQFVCFGNLNQTANGDDRERQDSFKFGNYNRNSNVFMYPGEKSCAGLASKKIDHLKTTNFFCLDVKEADGKVRVKLAIEKSDSLVTLSKT